MLSCLALLAALQGSCAPGPPALLRAPAASTIDSPTAAAHGPPAGTGSPAAERAERPAPGHEFVWPLNPQPRVVRRFDPPDQPWLSGHRGVDLAGSPGQEVRAAGAGKVVWSGVLAGRGVVSVEHADGRRTTYEPVDSRSPVGTVVTAGQRIGVLGAAELTHCAPAACLHWGLKVGPKEYEDPLTLVGAGPIVLLPLR